jgi:hypothetical protein
VPDPEPIPPATGQIVYLDPDGVTIKRIRPDGSGQQTVLTIAKQADEQVTSLSADPTGAYLLYSLLSQQRGAEYYLVRNGAAKKIGAYASTPRWAPNTAAFVAQGYASAGGQAQAHLYDVPTELDVTLAFSGVPDWFPDATRLVYVGFHATPSGGETADIYSYDIGARTSTQLTNLAGQGKTWSAQQAHVLPDGQHIVFFGGQRDQLGASGNGQQWWWIPASGGAPAAFSDPDGNGVTAYAASPGGDMVGYATSFHGSACISAGQIIARTSDVRGGFAGSPQLPELSGSGDTLAFVKGLSWEPADNYLAFAIQPYTCQDAAHPPQTRATSVYVWSFRAGNGIPGGAPRKLIDGSYPAWIK